jgi:hypothetical protein
MVAIAFAYRFVDGEGAVAAGFGPWALALIFLRARRLSGGRRVSEVAQPGSECGFDRLGVGRRELIFEWEGPVRPGGESLRINELLQLIDQLVSQVCGSVRREARWLGFFRTRSPFGRLRRPAGFWIVAGWSNSPGSCSGLGGGFFWASEDIGAARRSGASRSSSPAIPTRVNKV